MKNHDFDADLIIDQCVVDLPIFCGGCHFVQPILTVLLDRNGGLLATSLDIRPPTGWTALALLREAVRRQSAPTPTAIANVETALLTPATGQDGVSWEAFARTLPSSWVTRDRQGAKPSSGLHTAALLGRRLSRIGFRHTLTALEEKTRQRRAEAAYQRAMPIDQAREVITGLFLDRYESRSPYLRLDQQQRDAFLSTADVLLFAISPEPQQPASSNGLGNPRQGATPIVQRRVPSAVARLRDRPGHVDLTHIAEPDRDEVRRRLAAIDRFLRAEDRRGIAQVEASRLKINTQAFYRLVRTWRSSKSPDGLLVVQPATPGRFESDSFMPRPKRFG